MKYLALGELEIMGFFSFQECDSSGCVKFGH